jgi:hypothetical protein
LIESDEPAGGGDPFRDEPGVAAAADGAIDDRLAWLRVEVEQHFGGQDGNVAGGRHKMGNQGDCGNCGVIKDAALESASE